MGNWGEDEVGAHDAERQLRSSHTRVYAARDEAAAWEASAEDRARFAEMGYWPAEQLWSDGAPGIGRIAFLGWLAAVFPPKGTLTMVFLPRKSPGAAE
jgi:hypothetical protein